MQSTQVGGDGRILTTRMGPMGLVTIERPHKRNALTYTMWAAIPEALASLTRDPATRYVVLQGAQDHFSVGADLQQVHDAAGDIDHARQFCLQITRALYAIATCSLPTVAMMRGQAIGGALEMALAADFRFAAHGSQMQFPFVKLGMVPDPLTLKRLVALVGDPKARQLLFSAEMLESQMCFDVGLVQRLVPQQGLQASVTAEMASYRHPAPYVLERIKALLAGIEQADIAALADYRAQSLVHGGVRAAAARFLARRS